MLQHVLLLLFSICSYLVTMHIPQQRSNPGDDAKELGWCAYGPLESADMQDISDRPQKKNGRSSQVLFFYSLWHATKTWKWSCVHPHTSILMFKMFKMFKSTKFSKSLSRRRMKTPTRCRCQASPCTSPGTLPWGCGLEFKNMSIWLSKWQNGEITM